MLSLLQSFFKAEALVAFLAEFPYEALRPELTISARICAGFTVVKAFPAVKNPVLPHGASSIEKAILIRWRSGLKPSWPFIPALPGGAFWLFHVTYKHLLAGNVGIAIRVVPALHHTPWFPLPLQGAPLFVIDHKANRFVFEVQRVGIDLWRRHVKEEIDRALKNP